MNLRTIEAQYNLDPQTLEFVLSYEWGNDDMLCLCDPSRVLDKMFTDNDEGEQE